MDKTVITFSYSFAYVYLYILQKEAVVSEAPESEGIVGDHAALTQTQSLKAVVGKYSLYYTLFGEERDMYYFSIRMQQNACTYHILMLLSIST